MDSIICGSGLPTCKQSLCTLQGAKLNVHRKCFLLKLSSVHLLFVASMAPLQFSKSFTWLNKSIVLGSTPGCCSHQVLQQPCKGHYKPYSHHLPLGTTRIKERPVSHQDWLSTHCRLPPEGTCCPQLTKLVFSDTHQFYKFQFLA